MPYIKRERAKVLNPLVEELALTLESTGELNYVISRLAVSWVDVPSYPTLSAVRAVFADASDEFYRQLMAPYEDAKAGPGSPDNVGVLEVYHNEAL